VLQTRQRSSMSWTDSRVVLYCFHGKQQGYRNIRIRSSDTDIFCILLHYALELQGVTIRFDTVCRNKTSEICQESPICARALWNWGDFCNVLIGLTFPIPLNALVASQHVNACRPKRAVHNSCWYCCANLVFLMGMPFTLQVMMVPAYVAQKFNQLNRHRKKLIHELFFIVSMENNKDTEILELRWYHHNL
jgi:hypothetical protein